MTASGRNVKRRKAQIVGEFEFALKGRDFSRAVNAAKSSRLQPLVLQADPLPKREVLSSI
jgi:hypothetical protein